MADLSAAIAAAREAFSTHRSNGMSHMAAESLGDLLAALDAARGEAVAWRVWRGDSYELFFSEDAARRRCQCFVQQRSPEPLYAAPPAAVFKSTAKRVAALQARDAAQAPPAALAVPEGYALVPVQSLRWWRELAEINPQDLVPRIDAMLAAADKENNNG